MSFILEKYPGKRQEDGGTTDPMAASSRLTQQPVSSVTLSPADETRQLEEWAKAVVGRDWEIFWIDDGTDQDIEDKKEEKTGPQTESSSATVGPPPRVPSNNTNVSEPVASTNQNDKKEQGLRIPPSSDNCIMSTDPSPVKIELVDSNAAMEDDTTTMDISPGAASAEQDLELMQEDREDDNGDDSNEDNKSSSIQHQDGWYMGRIQDFHGLDAATGRPLFTVLYVGDEDEPCQVALAPEHVRPNGQRWILRTLALLLRTESPVDNGNIDPLPPDTRLPRDASALQRLAEEAASLTLPPIRLPTTDTMLDIDSATELSSVQHQSKFLDQITTDVIEFRHLAAQQIYLRTQLGPVVEDEDENDSEYAYPYTGHKPPAPPSEAYVDYLTQLLRNTMTACDWILSVYRDLLAPVYGGEAIAHTTAPSSPSTSSSPTVLTKEILLSQGLAQGQTHLRTLSRMDPTGRPKKRKGPSVPMDTKPIVTASRRVQNRHKRLRMDALFQNQSGSSAAGNFEAAPELEPEDLWVSTEVVRQYIRRIIVTLDDERQASPWCLRMVAQMMEALSVLLIDKYRSWHDNAEVFLGRREASTPTRATEDPTSDFENNCDGDNEEGRFFVSYNMLISAIDATQHDPVLSHFDFSNLVTDLRHKLKSIDDFEQKCWRDIERVLEDVDSVPVDPETDLVVMELRHCLRVSNDPQSMIGNVHPIGRDLTREVIENAIVYRLWFLDLVYAEATRERSSFIEEVVSQLSRLPPLQSPVVRSPKAASMDLSLTLDATAPRVQALSHRVLDDAVLSNRYKTALNNRQGVGIDWRDLEAKLDVDYALSDLARTSVLFVAEEMTLCRKDVLQWLRAAEKLFLQGKPPFRQLEKVHGELEILRNGQSVTRYTAIKGLRESSELDTEIRAFVLQDLEPFKESCVNKISDAFAQGSSWKVRFESVLGGLRAHGNTAAQKLIEYNVKNSPIVDLKRIEDLLNDYGELYTTFDAEHELLQNVFQEASRWEKTVTESLIGSEPRTLEDALVLAESLNTDDIRPKGVAVNPARHVLHALTDLLQWYQQVCLWIQEGRYHPRPYELMIVGAEIIEAYGFSQREGDLYHLPAEELIALVAKEYPKSKGKKQLSVSKLRAHPLTTLFLERTFDEILCHLLYFSWELKAKNLLDCIESSPKGTYTLVNLKAHNAAQPRLQESCMEAVEGSEVISPRKSLQRLTALFQEKENFVQVACAKSKTLQKDCIRNPEQARSHFSTLKDTSAFLKAEKVAIDEYLEGQLDAEVKLFTWMVKALDYKVLTSENPPLDISVVDERIPWDVLLKLKDSQPTVCGEDVGGLACLITRTNELHQMALAWRNEISAVTQLSLRGGKRRGAPAKEDTEEDVSEGVDMQKLTELCKRPILRKVAMPRERAVRSMMEHTAQFESKLHEFLGKDYDGVTPDRSPFPRGSSLVEDGGRFILPRLTASPLFRELKKAISEIDTIASDVFAQTPGIKTFQWIKRAVGWLDELHGGFTRSPSGRLVLGLKEAQHLADLGGAVLLDVPDDLKQTLSRHGIFVSIKKDGKCLTVKSKKKGAHYAIGTTMIRWCPILYNALRSDLVACYMWNEKFERSSCAYVEAKKAVGEGVTTAMILKLENDRQELSDLCHEVSRLVVVPAYPIVSQASSILQSLSTFLSEHSSSEFRRQAADFKFKNGKNVVPMRAGLRDALLDRLVSVHGALVMSTLNDEKNSLPFRYAARLVLKKALKTNAARLDLRVSESAIDSLCEMKAFEIEKEIHELFPGIGADDRINPDYRQQTLTLKRGLSNSENLELCLEILTGKTSPETVANMPSVELASQRLKLERAQAEAVAKNAAVLTKSAVKDMEETSKPGQRNKPALTDVAKMSDSDLNTTEVLLISKGGNKVGAEQPIQSSLKSVRPSSRTDHLSVPSTPTSPPLSLASSKRETWALSTSGSEQFQFSLGNNSRIFCGSLVEETRNDTKDISLPESLVEKGRLSVENFVGFANEKLRNSRWLLRTYRVIADTERDEKELNKFCKEYASKRRLSMLSLEDGAKIFLVPPQLTSTAKKIVAMKMENMVYAVLLFRKY